MTQFLKMKKKDRGKSLETRHRVNKRDVPLYMEENLRPQQTQEGQDLQIVCTFCIALWLTMLMLTVSDLKKMQALVTTSLRKIHGTV